VDRAVDHGSVVRVIDAGLEGTSAFIAMEYASGESLDVALRHLAPAPIERALPLLTEAARAIDAAWAAGLGHGALHPRDLIVPGDGDGLHMTGFGIVNALESIGEKAPVRRPYAAPERVAGRAWDVRADVYSLGVIAHEVLAGRRPAMGEQDGALAPGLAPEARVNIRRVLSAAMAESPDQRFASAAAFVEAIADAARGESVALPVGPRLPTSSSTVVLPPSLPDTELETVQDFASEENAPPAPPPAVLATPPPPGLPVAKVIVPPAPADPPAPSVKRAAPVLDLPAPGVERSAPAFDPPAPGEERPAPVFDHPAPIAERPASAFDHPAPSVERSAPSVQRPAPVLIHPALTFSQPEPEPHRYPWAAIAVVALAGVIAGAVGGYRVGWNAGQQRSASNASRPDGAAARADTDVPVSADPRAATDTAAPTAATPPAARTPAPTSTPAPETPVRTAAPGGRIVVRSVPAGALVFVDGRPKGETPATLLDLPLGAHTVKVARSGFIPRQELVTLTAATPTRTLAWSLERGLSTSEARVASVFLDTSPRGARAFVDGRLVGTTPIGVPELTLGEHTVRFELAGHEPMTAAVTIKPGVLNKLTLTLK
jgi:hypothetical protein